MGLRVQVVTLQKRLHVNGMINKITEILKSKGVDPKTAKEMAWDVYQDLESIIEEKLEEGGYI